MAVLDPFLLLLFSPKAVPWESHLTCAQTVPGTRETKNGGGGAVPLNLFSLFYFLFFSHTPPSTSTSGRAVEGSGAAVTVPLKY